MKNSSLDNSHSAKVRLVHYSDQYAEDLKRYVLPPEQLPFTAMPLEKLAELKEGQHPVVITANEQAVGFFILHTNEFVRTLTDHPAAILLGSFSVSADHQGKGYGTAGLRLLSDWVRQALPGYSEVVLSVNLKNDRAFDLYCKVGFEDTGRRIGGPIGDQRVMRMEV
ncbi:GNAT family N-acetyltransferase [Jeotgalibacillus sp. R-1-5s-1]|uniref:GNAT family N-acetyltransferase n=1 Tax=Jeotgalibacillus sp. R-1-5s-1 TaxID=2555897 RepID=UPI00106B7262|nr:GNAT family N-acetyltransferase [Jeotgalibacillus sp. R-1-5s-1]TFE00862.1 GNAT family N-acetyltransferase [Jeotgalibacillus sp. R-1-5s-1]